MATLTKASKQLFGRSEDEFVPDLDTLTRLTLEQKNGGKDRWQLPQTIRPVPHGDVVGLDAEVTYRELPGGARRTVRLVHPASADASKSRISVFAPVGRALLGRRAGARIPVALPNAAIDELHVLSVDRVGRLS